MASPSSYWSCFQSATLRPACDRMERRVPTATSRGCGTTAVRVPSGEARANFTWLPD